MDENIDERWLSRALAANQAGTPDALAIAMHYTKNAPPILLGDPQIAGDASYGPLLPNGQRDEGADFNDYLGLRWLYPADDPDRPRLSSIAVSIARATCGWHPSLTEPENTRDDFAPPDAYDRARSSRKIRVTTIPAREFSLQPAHLLPGTNAGVQS